jgi:hypothetical protein
MKKLLVLAVAIVVTFAFALPATAQDKAEWSWYGSVRMWTAWESVDDNTPPQLASQGAPGAFFQVGTSRAIARQYGGTFEDDTEVAWILQSNSRIGANVKWGNIGGRVEYGHTTTPTLRLLYGTWNFGPGTLLVGQDYGSYFYLISNLCGPGGAECNGIGFGSIYSGRTPQLKLIMGGFKVNLSSSSNVTSFNAAPVAPTIPTDTLLIPNAPVNTDRLLPKIEASYTFNAGPGQFFIGGIYNSYKEKYDVGFERDFDVKGWALGAGTRMNFGPFYANASFQIAENPNNSGAGPYTLFPSVQLYNPATDASVDSDYMGAQIILGFKLTDAMSFEGGFIWQNGDFDTAVLGNVEQSTYTYYLQMNWSPAKNVFITPEVGVVDYNKLDLGNAPDLDYGKLTWFGIKWMINF